MKRELKSYFGNPTKPYQESYNLKTMKIKENGKKIEVECTRCHKIIDCKPYKIHADGAITFSFRCFNCGLGFHIYRNNFEDFDKVHRVLTKEGK